MKYVLFFFAGLSLMSCSTSKLMVRNTEMKHAQVEVSKPGMVTRPLMADLSVENERKSVVYKGGLNLSSADLKANAMQTFLETYKCDFVVDPVFSTTTVIEDRKITGAEVKITGFAATYSKIYQVDSLPKSIRQFADLNKNYRNLNYYNVLEVDQRKLGIELSTGDHIGLQLDYPSKNLTYRFYGGYEMVKSNASPTDITFDANFQHGTVKDTMHFKATTAPTISQTTTSIGVLRFFPLSPMINFRILAGINMSMFNFSTPIDIVNPFPVVAGDFQLKNMYSLGIRLGAGVDYKIKNQWFVLAKFHSNLDFINIYNSSNVLKNSTTLSYSNVNLTGLKSTYLSVGIRYEF